MDTSENQGFRASKSGGSRLPTAILSGSGLQELSESQNNARVQSMLPPPPRIGKRELPQPAIQPPSKRKPLSERAAEYPLKSVAATPAPRSAVQGTSLIGASGLKQPSRYAPSRQGSTGSRSHSNNNFDSSHGPESRNVPYDRPKTSHSNHSRSVNGRSRQQPLRPQTALSNRDEIFEDSDGEKNAFDVGSRLGNIEQQFSQLKSALSESASDRTALEDTISILKNRVSELDGERDRLGRRNSELQLDVERFREETAHLRRQLEDEQWRHKNEIETVSRVNAHAREDLQRTIDLENERLTKSHHEELEAVKRHYTAELEDERREKSKEVTDLRMKMGNEQQDLHLVLQKKDREVEDMRSQIENLKGDLDREQTLKSSLQTSIAELSTANITMEARMNSLRSQIEFLESDGKAQSDSFASMEAKLQEALRCAEEARQKLIKEETERRVLFNKYQELKGNIRVMCRVRPVLDSTEGDEASLSFPDDKTSAKIGVLGPEEKSSLGNISRKDYPFEFDRVFAPEVRNEDVFGEISQLVQSALDGYNVCIFCYGQTGSGKTYTMSSEDGMIPRATHMIYDTITKLKEKSWTYSMEGSFVEVYNEDLHDLLTPADGKGKKLEIRHDEVRKQTAVQNCKTVMLDSAAKVEEMLVVAQNNRSVAATKANERSSRSHSVFILKLVGENSATGERCEGTLNLVDLAGSERLKHSGAEGDRMKETQNINKSLSCLGDVIDALGKGSAHIPYRNSKLTHLLQYSLGGNSKTLMFVMVSPLEAHLKETLTSLRFAAKVHNTHIGTAKATKKVREKSDS